MSWAWSRRSFLKAGAAAVSGGLMSGGLVRRSRGADDPRDAYGGFLMGLQTYTFRNFTADQAFDFARDLKIQTVEMFQAQFPGTSTFDEITARRASAKAHGLTILAHGVNPFTKDHGANQRWFAFAKMAGIRNLTADPTEDSFDSLEKLVEQFDIRIAIHNHGPGARYDKVADVLNAIKGRHPNIGACADLGHFIRSGEDPVRAIHLLKGRLFGVHLKDFADQRADAKGVILGQGHLQVAAVFKALREVEFPRDACLALEYEENPENPLDDVKACLAAAAAGAQQAQG